MSISLLGGTVNLAQQLTHSAEPGWIFLYIVEEPQNHSIRQPTRKFVAEFTSRLPAFLPLFLWCFWLSACSLAYNV